MTADGRLRPDYPPRGFVLSTGEDVPRGQSLQARLALLEIARGEVRPYRTHECPKGRIGRYLRTSNGRLCAVARHQNGQSKGKGSRRSEPPPRRRPDRQHHARPHTGCRCASAYGWECWLRYALACGAITEQERIETWNASGRRSARWRQYRASISTRKNRPAASSTLWQRQSLASKHTCDTRIVAYRAIPRRGAGDRVSSVAGSFDIRSGIRVGHVSGGWTMMISTSNPTPRINSQTASQARTDHPWRSPHAHSPNGCTSAVCSSQETRADTPCAA